jgi:ribokinase
VAAARAGATVSMIGRVGDDEAGSRMVHALDEGGVRTAWIRPITGTATGTAYITVTPDGENTIVLDPGANACLTPDDVRADPAAFEAVRVLLVQLEVPTDTVATAAALAEQCQARTVLTMAPARMVPGELLARLDPMLVNQHEAAFYLSELSVDDPEEAARRLLGLGVRSVVVTMGASGAVLADRTGVRRLPAVAVERVVDTTGAGDAFAGALAASLAHEETVDAEGSLDRAVQAGLVAAAEVIGRYGAR